MSLREDALKLHADHRGKISVESKVPVRDSRDLSLAYSPGVAEPCKEIAKNRDLISTYTNRANMVAVVSNGTAVLGLGDIGAYAAMPVMEGKAVLFKSFAGVDAFPICLDTKDVDKVVETVKLLAPTFGGINLEDISAPTCFEIERRLKAEMDIPVFHDDQHGTAVVVMAGLINSLKLVHKELKNVKVVTSGAGAAGTAIINLLMNMGVQNVIMCDSKGAIYEGRTSGMNKYKEEIARHTNREMVKGDLAEALKGADIFIGVSVANAVTQDMVKSMAKDPIIFAMANPNPEILPELANEAGAAVVGTGRSDYPNQVNNVTAFPGIFRGALDTEATGINEEMKIAAAYAIAGLVSDAELERDYVMPKAFDPRVGPTVAAAVAKAAMESGVARKHVDPEQVAQHVRELTGRQ
ncbi:malate dehydrogenase (oxaloacetate-decarboxylating) [Acididesulfobacillus acetoxydans]|uniref:Malate dehydrogenase (Oxaloacetate-decarboxylating) n=1 Tax=Acididesulfobacillus acetoxydans TaxID=1561005 RepID=A0A8S0XCG2_9FIRM|nr:malic enzyme-like NAD(P)-binding protein [Acididesulfobacillus acetoxydans]CAA7602416.1 malate dehydrogenase (oxaloacetate-decarboxylating) [Acididesulfobacillus acetoxydans]CEJ08349.1 NAD-dependent malic enzyme [Acididesulfobacillus acetoxydans]